MINILKAIQDLDLSDPLPEHPKRFTWEYRRQDIRRRIKQSNGDLSEFLHWPVAHEALYAGFTVDTAKELALLDEEHLQAITDPPVGRKTNMEAVGLSPHHKASSTYIRQSLALQEVSDAFKPLKEIESIFEFGAGFGALACVASRLGWQGKHTIFDFPELTIIQKWYHSQLDIAHDIEYITVPEDRECDLFISICALDEAPIEVRKEILDKVKAKFYLIWYHHNYNYIDNFMWFMDYFEDVNHFDYNPHTYSGQRVLFVWNG